VMVAVALGWTDRVRRRWLVTAGSLTYPLYLTHYAAGTAMISRLRDDLDPRLLVAAVLAGFLVLSWAVHRLVERPLAGAVKRGLDGAFARGRG
jgi:peptidoglycan/LPS O-acetylase OafA/YrhL